MGAAWAACAALVLGCAGGSGAGRRACLAIEASTSLNLHEGQPHAVVLRLYPLRDPQGFAAADIQELLRGEHPEGLSGEPWERTLLPGQRLELEEAVPRETSRLGVLVDFYRSPARGIVRASCGRFRRVAAIWLFAGGIGVAP